MPIHEGKWSGLSRKDKVLSIAKETLHAIKAMGGPAGAEADRGLQRIFKVNYAAKKAPR